MAARKLALLPAGARICGNEEEGAVMMVEGISFYPASLMAEVSDDNDLNHSIRMFSFRPEAHPDFRCRRQLKSCLIGAQRENEEIACWTQG
jgi:hypothetical protein